MLHVICALCRDCREGNTALHLACQSNQLKAIEVLLQWGARANMTNASGFAPVSTPFITIISILYSAVVQTACVSLPSVTTRRVVPGSDYSAVSHMSPQLHGSHAH